mgnify:CR=1 FL=1
MTDDARILIRRAGPLRGEVTIPGAKNSVLKLMAATLMADGEFTLTNVPVGTDTQSITDTIRANLRKPVQPRNHLERQSETSEVPRNGSSV